MKKNIQVTKDDDKNTNGEILKTPICMIKESALELWVSLKIAFSTFVLVLKHHPKFIVGFVISSAVIKTVKYWFEPVSYILLCLLVLYTINKDFKRKKAGEEARRRENEAYIICNSIFQSLNIIAARIPLVDVPKVIEDLSATWYIDWKEGSIPAHIFRIPKMVIGAYDPEAVDILKISLQRQIEKLLLTGRISGVTYRYYSGFPVIYINSVVDNVMDYIIETYVTYDQATCDYLTRIKGVKHNSAATSQDEDF